MQHTPDGNEADAGATNAPVPAPRVLVVDDFEPGRYSRSRLLRNAGFDVVEAATGAEALKAAQESICVVLLDVQLPDMSGLEVARLLKSSPATHAVPIVQISAVRTEAADAVAGLQGGADAYLVDPVDPSLLVATVRSMARARDAEIAAARAAAAWRATFDAISDAVLIVSPSGVIRRANAAARSLLPLPELTGAVFADALAAGGMTTPLEECPCEVRLGDRTFAVTSDVVAEEESSGDRVLVLRDVTATRSEQERIAQLTYRVARSEEFLRAVTESISTGVYVTDVDGRVTFVNRAAAESLGWRAEEMLGRNIHELIHHTKRDGSPHPPSECALLGVLQTGAAVQIENDWFIRKDGSGFAVTCSSSPLQVGGRHTGAAVAFHDISVMKRLEDALRTRAEELEDEGRAKDEFFAMISHELRTPMTSIIGWTQILRQSLEDAGFEDEGASEALDAIVTSASLQERIVSDMLDLSRVSTAKLHIERDLVDVAQVVEAVASAMRPAAEAKSLTLATSFDVPMKATVVGDAARLRQIASNLVANAIKFTPDGGKISVAVKSEETQVVLVVEDTGMGISPEFLPRIFQKFSQARSARGAGGLGLGLAIVRALVEAHDATISVASGGRDEGTRFVIQIPRAAA